MPKVRKDNKGRNLRPGETQRSDGSYMFVYKLGKKKKYIYDFDLASLRAKEKVLSRDSDDGIRTQEAMKIILNDMFRLLMDTKIQLKASTRANYEYLWDRYVKDELFASTPLPNIRKSDILTFYTKLLKKGFAINSLESINNLIFPSLELAVDDDYIRKNPSTRVIPILYPQVAEQLRALIEVMDALYPEDLVMNGYHGFLFRNRTGYFLSAHNINRAIERISIAYNAEEMDQAELEDREPDLLPHFSVHNLRHTFCTRLCESTNDIKFIQQVMGHADFSTTMDIYTHITQENMKEKAEVIKGTLVLM